MNSKPESSCIRCGKKPFIYLQYQGQSLCRHCFARLIVRRVRSNLRNKRVLGLRPVVVIDDGSAAFGVARFVLEQIAEETPKLRFILSKKQRKGLKTVICRSLEEECVSYIKGILNGKKARIYQNPTCNIPRAELEKFCEIKDISYKEHKYPQPDYDILSMTQKMLKLRPGAFFSIQRMSERLG